MTTETETAGGHDTFILIRNAVGALVFAGLAIYFYQKGNKEAAMLCLTNAGALFVHSGRARSDDAPLGAVPLLCVLLSLAGCQAAPTHLRLLDIGRDDPRVTVVQVQQMQTETAVSPFATSITPITSLAAAASGLSFSGQSYDVACTVSGSVTLYPAAYGTAWQVYQQFPCTLNASTATQGTCTFPAEQTPTALTWNAFLTGTGSVSSCTAAARQGPAPASKAAPASGPGSGTVTSVGLALPGEFVVSGSPVTTSGTLTGAWATEAANLVFAGPASGGAATPSFRALVAGDIPPVSPSGAAGGDLSGTYPNPTVAAINGATLGTTTAASGNLLIGSGAQWVTRAMSGDATISSTGTATLATVNASPGTFGDGTHVAQVTVNGKGLATTVASVAITYPGGITGFANPTATVGPSAVNGVATTAMRSDAAPALANTAVTPGSYGDATHVPNYTVDAQGRLTAAASTAITYPGGMTGFANPTATIGLTAVNGVATTAMRSDAAPALASVVTGATCASPSSLTFNNAGQITACTAGSGAVTDLPSLTNQFAPNTTLAAGSFTVGNWFVPSVSGQSVTGVRFQWPADSARTIKAQLWTTANTTSVANASASVTGPGTFTIAFGSPVAVTVGTQYAVTVWETSGTKYPHFNAPTFLAFPTTGGGTPCQAGQGSFTYTLTFTGKFAGGDAFPSSNTASEGWAVEPY